jgi:tetratricopeptide (TPR) repeat protein
LVCAELIETWHLEIEAAALLLSRTGYYLNNKANYAQAKPLFERALAIDEKVYGKDHPDVATNLNNLAGLLRDQGDYAQATL